MTAMNWLTLVLPPPDVLHYCTHWDCARAALSSFYHTPHYNLCFQLYRMPAGTCHPPPTRLCTCVARTFARAADAFCSTSLHARGHYTAILPTTLRTPCALATRGPAVRAGRMDTAWDAYCWWRAGFRRADSCWVWAGQTVHTIYGETTAVDMPFISHSAGARDYIL